METLDVDVTAKLLTLLECSTDLCQRCQQLKVSGINKLYKKCQAEHLFLLKLMPKSVKANQLNSTNLYHLQGVVTAAEQLPDVSHVLQRLTSEYLKHPITIDVICHQGQTWVKVIARNVKALTVDIDERGQFGSKRLVDQAVEYIELAKLKPHEYVTPRVLFLFFNTNPPTNLVTTFNKLHVQTLQLTNNLLTDLEQPRSTSDLETVTSSLDMESLRKSMVESCAGSSDPTQNSLCDPGPMQQCSDCVTGVQSPGSDGPLLHTDAILIHNASLSLNITVSTVNLDVTTLIALTSNVTNGGCNYTFTDSILTQQATDERVSPCLPRIEEFIAGKQLIVCQSALSDFQSILDAVGGQTEKQRAFCLLSKLLVVADRPSLRALQLRLTAHIKCRARTVFGTGDSYHAVTTTANIRFVRATAQAGLEFVVFEHPARALTELKQCSATQLK